MEVKERGRGRREKHEKVAGARKLVDGNCTLSYLPRVIMPAIQYR